jgi:predicted nucleic acid-binding protein
MASRRARIARDQIDGFVTRLKALPIDIAPQSPSEILELSSFAQVHGLTIYDAAYLAPAHKLKLPLATTDSKLRQCVVAAGVQPFVV